MSQKIKQSVMSPDVVNARAEILSALLKSPVTSNELLRNLGLYLLPMELKRYLFFDSLYRQFLNTPGIICEFGCRWGQNLAVLQGLRAVYEPYNLYRTIVGFDTFSGLRGVAPADGQADFASEGAYGVSEDYEQYLERLLTLKESQSPLPQIKKFRIVKGDAAQTFRQYLDEHPETIVSFAYFDMDIYQPTVDCLRLLKGHVTKGSVIGFDELNFPEFPGETRAFQEVFGAPNVRLQRNQWCGAESFFVVE